jgi:hypothetical protein
VQLARVAGSETGSGSGVGFGVRSESGSGVRSESGVGSETHHFGYTTLIFGPQNPGSGSVFNLKCWIRLRSNEYGSETLDADPYLNVTDPDTTENEGPTWEA